MSARVVLNQLAIVGKCEVTAHVDTQVEFNAIVELAGELPVIEFAQFTVNCRDVIRFRRDGVKITVTGPVRKPSLRDWTRLHSCS